MALSTIEVEYMAAVVGWFCRRFGRSRFIL